MNHEKTFAAIKKLQEVELEMHRLKNALELANKALDAQSGRRLELIGHADLGINNIYIFSNHGEEVPAGRTPIYAGYTTKDEQ